MATNYPAVYAQGHITKTIDQFRQTLPSVINANTLKKLGIAPKNEFRVITLFRFLGFIDDTDQPTELANNVFFAPNGEFEDALSQVVRDHYSELFDLHKDNAWDLDSDKLIAIFRNTDKSSLSTGKAQAATFTTLASLSHKRETKTAATTRPTDNKKPSEKKGRSKKQQPLPQDTVEKVEQVMGHDSIGLTVRIEINLPANGSQSTYDMIFKSIRQNLLNG